MLLAELLKIGVRGPVMIEPDARLTEAARTMVDHRTDFLVVTDSTGRIVGTLSDADIVEALAAHDRSLLDLADLTVAHAMRRDPLTGRPEQSLDEARRAMMDRQQSYLPIVTDGRPVGLVSIGDILLKLFRDTRLEEEHLRDYFLGLGYH